MTKYFKHFVISRQYDEWWEICQKSSTASLEMNPLSSLPRTCCWPQYTLILLFSSSFQTRIWKGDKYLAFTYDRSFYWYFWWVQKLSCGECTLPWGSSWLLVSWSSYQSLYCLQIDILVRNWAKPESPLERHSHYLSMNSCHCMNSGLCWMYCSPDCWEVHEICEFQHD